MHNVPFDEFNHAFRGLAGCGIWPVPIFPQDLPCRRWNWLNECSSRFNSSRLSLAILFDSRSIDFTTPAVISTPCELTIITNISCLSGRSALSHTHEPPRIVIGDFISPLQRGIPRRLIFWRHAVAHQSQIGSDQRVNSTKQQCSPGGMSSPSSHRSLGESCICQKSGEYETLVFFCQRLTWIVILICKAESV